MNDRPAELDGDLRGTIEGDRAVTEELFARFLDESRRAVVQLWYLRSFCRGVLVPALPFVVLIWFRDALQLGLRGINVLL